MESLKDQDEERELTRLLDAMNAGEAGASDQLAEHIFDDLRAMARRRMKAEGDGGGVTLQPTMLASDTLMKLIRQRERFDNGGHLFAIASRVMMRLLIDYHRTRKAAKRGGADLVRVSLDPDQAESETGEGIDVEALSAALEKLASLDARKADVVRYRVLWGLTAAEIARSLSPKVSAVTVERDWAFAKAWLAKELSGDA
ncbi:MAG: ECF-type sigma factor [Tepidisphaeraceae bacterium]